MFNKIVFLSEFNFRKMKNEKVTDYVNKYLERTRKKIDFLK